MTEKIIKTYWEDMTVGQTRDLGTVTPTAEEIIAFATQFDPQPFHLDEEAAKASVFGALCASGWHTVHRTPRLWRLLRPDGTVAGRTGWRTQ